MSDSLSVKRQKLCRELRRKEVESYMKKVRESLTTYYLNQDRKGSLTEDILDRMRDELDQQLYSTESCVFFLRSINNYQEETLSSPFLFVIIKRIFDTLYENRESNAYWSEINELAKKICLKVIEHPRVNNSLLIEKCYDQILDLAGNGKYELWELWPVLGLVRSEAFHTRSLIDFLVCIVNYERAIDDVLSFVLDSFANFTADIEGEPRLTISIKQCHHILQKLDKILEHFELGDKDMMSILKTLQNIIKPHPFSGVVKMISDTAILDNIMTYLENWSICSLDRDTIRQILEFCGMILSGSSACTQEVLRKHKKFFQVFRDLLPVSPTFNQISQESVKWLHNNTSIIIGTLFCLSNISAAEDTIFSLITHNIIREVTCLSKYPNAAVKAEVSIFLFNCSQTASPEQIQILCEMNMLYAINNLIREEYSAESIEYGLKALIAVLKKSQTFPTNNIAWHFNYDRVVSECQRYDLINVIENLVAINKERISNNAVKCLQLLTKSESSL